jgi:16S rRNA (uracil1498-N3)-methyltransferase
MPDRYFVPEPLAGEFARLDGEEAHHLSHVMRARPGDEVLLFDGSGAEWQARVQRLGRSEVELQVLSRHEIDRELPADLLLAVALPKGERQRWLVEKAVELGVHRLTPLVTERGVAQPVEKALLRLRRTVIEASKQCGRNRLMEITEPVAVASYFTSAALTNALRAVADPGGQKSVSALFATWSPAAPRRLDFAVGPEGGFSPMEVSLAATNGWSTVELGPRILRIETAAIYLASVGALACQVGKAL